MTKYAPCEIVLEFGDGDHRFKLNLKLLAELQEKCGAGIGAIFSRLMLRSERIEDCVEIVRLGLIGGGMEPMRAKKMVDLYLEMMPHDARAQLARAIAGACMFGYAAPTKSKKKARTTETDDSTSAKPTGTEPSADSHPEKSIN